MAGICCDAQNPVARPSMRKLKALGVDLVRLVATESEDCFSYDQALAKAGIQRAYVFTGSTFDIALPADLSTTARRIASKLQPGYISIVANEFDMSGAASWPAGGPEAFVGIWKWVAPVLPSPRYVGGLFDAAHAMDTLDAIWDRLDPFPDGVDLHPYLLTGGQLVDVVRAIKETYGVAVSCGEWNDSTPKEIGPFQALLDDTVDWSCWIPFSTEQLNGELPGIYRGNRLTSVGKAYRAAIR